MADVEVVNEWCVVKKSSIHNKGVFARKDIPEGTKVIEYVGEKITNKEADKRADRDDENGTVYLFEISSKYTIDGDVDWNPARFINHTCEENCESDVVKGKIWITSIKPIKKGEELSYDYGFDYDVAIDHPCRCGMDKCRGYIVHEHQLAKLNRLLAKKKKKKRRQ